MDYSCAKFGDCIFSRFGFIVRTDIHTDRQNHTHRDAAYHLTHATVVGVISEKVTRIFYSFRKKYIRAHSA